MLILKNIYKTYRSHTILYNINVSVYRGEIALFLGKSGVGKSTLLRVISGLETPDRGSCTFDMKEIKSESLIKNQIAGMVFQHFNLFEHMNVIENITIALEYVQKKSRPEAMRIGLDLLDSLSLADKAYAMPYELSGGQKQRVAIARAIALNPSVLCLDEPTSALDPQLSRQTAHIIQNLAYKQYTIAIASHDASLIEYLDCTIHLMYNSSIIESASSIAFKKKPDHYPCIRDFINGPK